MSKKAFSAWAGKCGSTGEVATAIGKTFARNGVRVEVLPLKEVTDLPG